jgi:hypothetical protein
MNLVSHIHFIGYKFIDWLVSITGYFDAMIIKNFIIFVSGGIAFSILTFIFLVWLRNRITFDEDIKGVSVLRIHIKGKKRKHIYVHPPKTLTSAIETLFGLGFYFATFQTIPIILSDNKRRKALTHITILFLAFILLFGILLALRVVTPNMVHK